MNTRKLILSIALSALLCLVSAPVMAENPDSSEPELDASTGYYNISTLGELFWLAQQVNDGNTSINARLMNDIEFMDWLSNSIVGPWLWEGSGYLDFNNQEDYGSIDWTPIGTREHPYSGTFEGNGHTIKNLCFAPNSQDHGILDVFGLFGYTNGAIIRCLHMKTCASYASGSVGTIVAEASNNTIIALCSAEDVIVHSDFSEETSYIGGIVGRMDGGTVENCLVSEIQVAKNPTRTGGLVGCMTGGTTLKSCYVRTYKNLPEEAAIFGDNQAGGTNELCFYLTNDAHVSADENGLYRASVSAERSGFCCLMLNGAVSGSSWGQRLNDYDDRYPKPKGEGLIAHNECVYTPDQNIFIFFNMNEHTGEADYSFAMLSDDMNLPSYTGEDYPMEFSQQFGEVQYYRTVTPGTQWHTLWLPFAVQASENYEYKFFVMSEEQNPETGVISLTQTSTLPAWTPGFLYKPDMDDYFLLTAENAVVTNVITNHSDTVSVGYKYIACNNSTGEALSVPENTINMFLSGDAVWIDSQKKVVGYPYRCYWNVPVSGGGGGDGGPIVPYGAAPFRLEIKDPIDIDVVTGICTLEEEKASRAPLLFDLSGRRIEEEQPRGLFINNLTKVLVR